MKPFSVFVLFLIVIGFLIYKRESHLEAKRRGMVVYYNLLMLIVTAITVFYIVFVLS